MLDCKPFMMRGVSYSPVPWSHDPSYHEPFGDYFTDEFHDIVKRDLALFVEMGANTARPIAHMYPYGELGRVGDRARLRLRLSPNPDPAQVRRTAWPYSLRPTATQTRCGSTRGVSRRGT